VLRSETPKTVYLKDYTQPVFTVPKTEMVFRIFKERTEVETTLHLTRKTEGELVLLGERLILTALKLNGQDLAEGTDYTVTSTDLTVKAQVNTGDTLTIGTTIDPANNTSLEGLYASGTTFCTQCEPEGFRKITYFPDRPDVLSIFTVRVEADKATCPVLLSNGNLTGEGDLPSGRHYTEWHDPFPKPCYLFALVAGDLVDIQDSFTTMTGRKVDLRIYVKAGDEGQCHHAMDSLIRSMKWDEEVYGREYQLDRFNIVAVSDFNFGAMENTSLNIFNTALVLAHPDLATDNDFLRVEGVVAHEYFHNWSGNRVTCRDWFQLSLKEGLTVFRDQEFSADMHSRAVKRIDDVAQLRRLQFPEDAGPLAHPIRPDNYIEINNFYTTTVYEKGAEVIRMQRTLMGNEKYRKGTDLYFDRFDGQAVTCDDFIACMQEASGLDLDGQFKLWYRQAGTPEVSVTTHYDEANKRYTLAFRQTVPATPGQPTKSAMVIPIVTALLGANGQALPLDDNGTEEKVLTVTESEQSFTFENIPTRPVPSLLRNFSAPVRLRADLSADDLRFLMVHDTDGFNRWESMQLLAMQEINRILASGGAVSTDPAFIATYGALLKQAIEPDADRALLARMLQLPEIALIAQEQEVVDPTAIYKTRMQVMRDLATAHAASFAAVYDATTTDAPYDMKPTSMARRALRNSALRYLLLADEADGVKRAYAHYQNATNMTDRMAGLSVLCDTSSEEREKALADFFTRFEQHMLVIDKWFAVQAMAVRPTTQQDVEVLSKHSAMIMKNPNRARALYASFAMNNPATFHDPAGNGYTFLRDAIIALNGINPQIGARLCMPLREWKRYTPDRQAKMKAVLQEIKALPDLSREIYEIVTKSLDA
jgi:aminopeptidase N